MKIHTTDTNKLYYLTLWQPDFFYLGNCEFR